MTWFTARVIIGMHPVGEENGIISVYENSYLIEAENSNEAMKKATEYGKEEEALNDGLEINGKPSIRIFAGVRNVQNISNPYPLDLDNERPTTGTELAYSVFEIKGVDELNKLARGESVTLRYVE